MAKLKVNSERCQGHARCFVLAPETFTLDEEGYAQIIEGREHSHDEENVRKAMRSCPERAIEIIEEES